MKNLVKTFLRRFGYDITRYPPMTEKVFSGSLPDGLLPDFSPSDQDIIAKAKPFTLTSYDRLGALVNAVDYIIEKGIPGDIAECGVWRGGSMMAVASALLARGDKSRSLYLYDTYEGMPNPTEADVDLDGVTAVEKLKSDVVGTGVWCYASIEDVRVNILSTGYPEEKIHLIKGKVEETIPGTVPATLSLLRLDTDWYESTRHELINLYPRLNPKGILILDDYGHWKGSRKAVDEYFKNDRNNIYLHRIDYSGRILIKTSI